MFWVKMSLIVAGVALGCAACGGSEEATGALAEAKRRGTLRFGLDPAAAPQSARDGDGAWSGFNIEVARRIAEQVNVRPAFLPATFAEMASGGWNGGWDIAAQSVVRTPARESTLKFSEPYYYAGAYFAVAPESTIASVAELDGKTICVASASTYLDFLLGTLDEDRAPPAGVTIVEVASSLECVALVTGDMPTADAWLASDTSITAQGEGVKKIDDQVFAEAYTFALDGLRDDNDSLLAETNEALRDARSSGDSVTWSTDAFGVDRTRAP